MFKIDQQELIIQRIAARMPIFKTFKEFEQFPKLIKSREQIQRSILNQIQKSVQIIEMDPLQYGQKELKDVMNLMEEQLKTMYIAPLSYEEKKKQKFLSRLESKQIDGDESNHPKKQRVDKNKCRVCKNSTIPMILDLLKQTESQDTNPHVTMKSIRQSIVQKSQKKEEQSESKVPYIAFDYSDRIVICKRCRFKFHAECVQVIENINDWICDYCLERIKELKDANQWDYVNNKQLKQSLFSDQKNFHQTLIDRIQKKQKIFIIEHMGITPFKMIDQSSEFLKKYPLYKNQYGKIQYPILEQLALPYPDILTINLKPSPYMINSERVEDILKIQTIYQLLFPKAPIPQNVNQDYIEKNFYDLLINLLTLYCDELFKDDIKFEECYSQANAITSAFLVILSYLYNYKEEQTQDLLKKAWPEFIIQIDQIINYNTPTVIDKMNFNDELNYQQQIDVLMLLVDGAYQWDFMKKAIENKDQNQNLKQLNLKQLFQQHPSAFINCGTFLGQDAQENSYFYFTHVPSSIFVETDLGWGQYTLSDLPELMNSLNQQGINEFNLYENLLTLSSIKLFDAQTPIKQQNRLIQKQQYALDINEVIEQFYFIEELYSTYLITKNLIWIEPKLKSSFLESIKNAKFVDQLIKSIQQFYNGLILLKHNNGKQCKPFRVFKQTFELANQMGIYVDNAKTIENIQVILLSLGFMLEEYQEYKQQKELKQIKEQAKQKKQAQLKKEIIIQKDIEIKSKRLIQKKKKLIIDESESEQISVHQTQNNQDNLANRREKRENAGKNPNITFDSKQSKQRKINCNQCNKVIINGVMKCTQCQKQFHQDCLISRKNICKNCQKVTKKSK